MAHISIVGLGSGDENQLTLGVWNEIQTADRLFIRTADHPVVRYLDKQSIRYESFDKLYEAFPSFEEVYEGIALQLMKEAEERPGKLVYAVPGHPMVAESTVWRLKAKCEEKNIDVTVHGGESFLDQVFLRLGFDPVEGFMLLDATSINPVQLQPDLHTIITQVYDMYTASEAKLSLLELYPPEFEVVVAQSLGIPGAESIRSMPLVEIDRLAHYGNHMIIWVPRSDDVLLKNKRFERLQEIVRILRSPEGCPWDREQTHASIRKNLIEETYEVLETIDDEDPAAMCEELGDLLLQIMLHSQMEDEEGNFSVSDVIEGLNDKLIRRHPHVFGDVLAENAGEALKNWDQVKAEEKKAKGIDVENRSLLDGVPRELPGTMKALEFQKRAAKVGFDWDNIDDVFGKVEEELKELRETVDETGQRRKEELGDLLFAVINAARFLKVDPEEALSAVNRKFYERFSYIECRIRENQRTFAETSLEEMEAWWQEAKKTP